MTGRGRPAGLASLEEAVLALKDTKEVRAFLAAMLSRSERQRLTTRWKVYQLRSQGKTLAQIVRATHVAMATATRAAQLRHGSSSRFLDAIMIRILKPRRSVA